MLQPEILKGSGMPALEWTDALTLDLPMMDETHHEFVDLLNQVAKATDGARDARPGFFEQQQETSCRKN